MRPCSEKNLLVSSRVMSLGGTIASDGERSSSGSLSPSRLTSASHLVEIAVELALVVPVEGLLGSLVELVQAPDGVVSEAELPLSHDADDHFDSFSSSFCLPPDESSPLRRSRSASTWLCVEIWASSRSSCVPEDV